DESKAERMERRNRKVLSSVAEDARQSLAQRGSGGRGEGGRGDGGCTHSALLDQVCDAPGQHRRLTATRTGKDAEWAIPSLDDLTLAMREVAEVQTGGESAAAIPPVRHWWSAQSSAAGTRCQEGRAKRLAS